MWPLLENGDSISISKVSSVQKGDIITVQNPYNRILTHRVMHEKELITKGDNNVFPEKALTGKSFKLLGKVDYVIRDGKHINIDHYNTIFYKYSTMEMKVYAFIKKIVPVNSIIYFIKQITYPIFIFILKLRYGRDY